MVQNKFGNATKNRNSGPKFNRPVNRESIGSHDTWLYGKHPVLAALQNHKRKVYQILVTKNSEVELKKFISDKNLSINPQLIKLTDNDHLNSLFSEGSIHQGLALKTSPVTVIDETEFLVKAAKIDKENLPPLLILDQLTDPHNIGAIIRSAVAFGVKHIVVTKRNFPENSPVAAKSSSGMIELVDLIAANNLNNFLLALKKVGYWSVGLDGEAKMSIEQIKDYSPLALVVGSEGAGIRQLLKTNCDLLAKINISPEVESLNASNAAAISMYQLFGNKILS